MMNDEKETIQDESPIFHHCGIHHSYLLFSVAEWLPAAKMPQPRL
jgi:hypothetical protein